MTTGGMFDLNGKVTLITGATGGIGGSIARALHRQGATLALSGTRRDALEAMCAEFGDRCAVFPCDLTDRADADKLIPAVEAQLGKVDVLVNNAGITRDNLLLRMKDEEWDDIQATNLRSVFVLSRAVLRGMMKARTGRIVNVASVVGFTGNPGQSNYAAAKAGMVGFSKSLAREIGSRNITVNCVAPGFIETDMTRSLGVEQSRKLLENVPLGRLGKVEDVAQAVLFLCSPGAAYITGATLHVNGGMYMD